MEPGERRHRPLGEQRRQRDPLELVRELKVVFVPVLPARLVTPISSERNRKGRTESPTSLAALFAPGANDGLLLVSWAVIPSSSNLSSGSSEM